MKAKLTPQRALHLANDGEGGYAMYHARRYEALLSMLRGYVDPTTTVLDVGRSRLTGLINREFGAKVDNLGFCPDESTPEGRSFRFDLNDAQEERCWRRDLPRYDVIVMAEVIEHLHTAPRLVLEFLRTLLNPRGVLIVQTPNAACLHKRVKLLAGKNPYEMIREDTSDPGHFRELTGAELREISVQAGYSIEAWSGQGYFDFRYREHAVGLSQPTIKARLSGTVVNAIYQVAPASLRPGQSIVLRVP